MKPAHQPTPPCDRVALPMKLSYGAGMMAYALMVNGFGNMVNPIFNVNLGVSAVAIGWILGFGRLWDAVTDPYMGALSDRTRGAWGRRRPWIALGAVLGGVTFALIWMVPEGRSDTYYTVHLVVTMLLFYLAFTVFSVPYIAMGMEMSPDYHERTRVVAWRTFLAPVGAFIGQAGLFWLTQRAIFDGTVQGMRWVGLAAGAAIIALGIIPALFAREHPYAKPPEAKEKAPFWTSAKETLRVPPFLLLCLATVVLLVGLLLVANLGFYMNLYVVYGGDQEASADVFALAMGSYMVINMASIPLITWISTRAGKRNTIFLFLGFAFIGTLSKWVCYRPDMPYLQLVPHMLMALGMSAVWMLINAMLPDTVDYDELNTGKRREGMFSAIYSWVFKLGVVLSLICSGYILEWSGYDPGMEGNQTDQTLFMMRVFYSLVPAVGLPIGAWFLWKYKLTEARAHEIRRELDQRKAAQEKT